MAILFEGALSSVIAGSQSCLVVYENLLVLHSKFFSFKVQELLAFFGCLAKLLVKGHSPFMFYSWGFHESFSLRYHFFFISISTKLVVAENQHWN